MARMEEQAQRRMSLDEFLAWDDGTDVRFELIDGVPVAMAPTSGRHAEMAVNLSHAFAGRIAGPCRAASGAGVRIPRRDDLYFVPDLVVTCASPPYDKTWAVEPRLVCEILSPSTSRYDRTEKLDAYKSVASIEDILLIDQDRRHVQHWHRQSGGQAGGWHVFDHVGDAVIALDGLAIALPVAALYAGLEM